MTCSTPATKTSYRRGIWEALGLSEVLDALDLQSVIRGEPSELAIQTGQNGRMEKLVRVEGGPAGAAYPERGVNRI